MEEKLNQLAFINAALFGILVAVAYYVFFYRALSPHNQIEKIEQEVSTIKKDILRFDKELKVEQKINQEVIFMQDKINKVYSQLSENLSVERAVNIISEEARSTGMSIESISATSGGWQEQKTIAITVIDVRLSGSFNQVMVFLSELTRSNRIYSVSSLLLNTREVGKKEALSITLKLQAYRKLTAKEMSLKKDGINE